jgi:hypothetical protein
MTKTKIIQHLREMLRIAEQDEDDFFEEYKTKHPDMEWLCERGKSYSMKLGIIESKIEFILMYLEADVKEEEKYGRQEEDLRQAVGDAEADKTAL